MRQQTPTSWVYCVHDHVPQHGLVCSLSWLALGRFGLYLRWEDSRVMARARDVILEVKGVLAGLVWSSPSLAAVELSSMTGLGSTRDQKITTTCQQSGSLHMLSGECICQVALTVSYLVLVSIQGASLLIKPLQNSNFIKMISESVKACFIVSVCVVHPASWILSPGNVEHFGRLSSVHLPAQI